MKKTPKLQQLVLAAIYLTLGIPLVVTSTTSPSILNPENSKVDDFFKENNVACVSGKMIKFLLDQPATKDIPSSALKAGMDADSELASKMNSVRSCSLVIGIILLCFAFLNIVSVFIPKKGKK